MWRLFYFPSRINKVFLAYFSLFQILINLWKLNSGCKSIEIIFCYITSHRLMTAKWSFDPSRIVIHHLKWIIKFARIYKRIFCQTTEPIKIGMRLIRAYESTVVILTGCVTAAPTLEQCAWWKEWGLLLFPAFSFLPARMKADSLPVFPLLRCFNQADSLQPSTNTHLHRRGAQRRGRTVTTRTYARFHGLTRLRVSAHTTQPELGNGPWETLPKGQSGLEEGLKRGETVPRPLRTKMYFFFPG